MRIFKFMLVIAVMVAVTSCGGDEDATPQDPAKLIVGTWTVQSGLFLGISVPDGESTLTFDTCGADNCTGADYEGFDETSGEFTYSLNEAGTKLTIIDEDENGGDYSGEWTVDELNGSSLKISISTFLGPVSYSLTK